MTQLNVLDFELVRLLKKGRGLDHRKKKKRRKKYGMPC